MRKFLSNDRLFWTVICVNVGLLFYWTNQRVAVAQEKKPSLEEQVAALRADFVKFQTETRQRITELGQILGPKTNNPEVNQKRLEDWMKHVDRVLADDKKAIGDLFKDLDHLEARVTALEKRR